MHFVLEIRFRMAVSTILVGYRPATIWQNREEFSIHPEHKNPEKFIRGQPYLSFAARKFLIVSNRGILREKGYTHRPQYWLEQGEMKGEHLEIVVKEIDKWVKLNLDVL